MMRVVRIFALLLFLAVAVAGLWVAFVGELDLSAWRPEIRAAVKQATGREVSIDGEIEVDLLPLPTLHAGGLKLSNAAWGSRETMLTAGRIEMSVQLVPLMFGDFRVRSMSFDDADLLLETNADGQANWEFGSGGDNGATGDDASPRMFDSLRRLDATGLDVEWRAAGEQPHKAALETARLGARRLGGFAIALSGSIDGRPIDLEGELSSPIAYFRGRGLRGKVRSRSPKLTAVIEGNLGRFPTLEGIDLTIDASGSRWPVLGDLSGLPEGDTPPWKISLQVTEQDGVLNIAGLDFQSESNKVSGDLKLDRRGDGPRIRDIDLRVDARGESWPYLATLIGSPTGDLPPWRAAFHIAGDQDRLDITDIDALLDESDLAGSGTIELSRDKPRISAKISSKLLDVSTPEQWWQGTLQHPLPTESGDRLFSDEPVQTDWMHEVDLKLDITADELKTEDLTVEQAIASITVQGARLQFDIDATVYGGRGRSRMSADASRSPMLYQQTLEIIDADMHGVTTDWFGSPLLDAKGRFRYDIAGAGDSAAEIMANLSGSGTLVVGQGMARAGVAERAVRNLTTMVLATLLQAQKVDNVEMNCLVSDVTVSDGIAQFDVLVLDTEKATVIGSGSANLKDETWDLYLKPKPKVVALSASVPVHLAGPFAQPDVTAQKLGVLRKLAGAVSLFVFPPAAVAGLADFGAGNPCVDIAKSEQAGDE
jgi:uncharacterized protein involved in outer membrane biogenesis